MAPIKSASRYDTFDSRSSLQSDPSSSTELKINHQIPQFQSQNTSRALVRTNVAAAAKGKNEQNLSAMVKKFLEKRSKPKGANGTGGLVIPADLIAEDLKRTARKGANVNGLHRKLFTNKGKDCKIEGDRKALSEVKSNTRTLAMVLRSERELLNQNKEHEAEITELMLMLEEKNREMEMLKDLCLKQREEIKTLKSAVLFPEIMNSQLHGLLEKQGSELNQANQLIPSLQRQVTSLTGQIQCLAQDLAEVKADKNSLKSFGGDDHFGSPNTRPAYDQDGASNSLELSSGYDKMVGSPDDMLLKDLNPCLTPYYTQRKSKDFEPMAYESLSSSSDDDMMMCDEDNNGFDPCPYPRSVSKSSDSCCQQRSNPNSEKSSATSFAARATRRSDDNRRNLFAKQIMYHQHF